MAGKQLGSGTASRRDVLRAAGLLGAGAVFAPALAACSDSDSPGTSPSGDNSPGTSPSGGTPKKGGTLRVGAGGGNQGDTVDAHQPISQLDNLRVSTLYDQLTVVDNEFKFGNQLAESVESNADATEWTIRIRQDIEFHSGKTLDADDVIFSFQRIFDPDVFAFGSLQLGPVDVAGIEKLDSRTIRVPMSSPYATFNIALGDGALLGIVPVDYDPAEPVGTGPFKYVSFTPGERSEFVKFENYWGDEPYLDSVVISNIGDNDARVNAILSGQVDVITQVPFAQIESLESNPDIQVLESRSGGFQPLVFRSDRPPFDDVRMRQAVRLLVDREQAIEVALLGHGQIASDLYSPFDPNFDSSLVRSRDIDQATSLIREAGYAGETIELVTSPLAAGLVEFCSVLAQNAKDANLNIEVTEVDPATLFGASDLEWNFSASIWPAATFLTTASLADVPESNGAHWHNDDYRALFAQAQATTDATERAEIEKQMQKVLFDSGPYLIPYFPNHVEASISTVGGWPDEDLSGIGLGRAAFGQVYFTE